MMHKNRLFNYLSHGQLAVLVIGVLVGIFFRMYQLGALPDGLYWDETAILVDAISVSQTGRDMHGRPWYQIIYPSYGDYKLPVYIWLSSVAVKIFGPSEWAVRLPSALTGVVTMLLAGLVALQLGKVVWPDRVSLQNWLAIVAVGIVAVSPWSIIFSRTGFEAHVGQLLLGAAALILVGSTSKWRWLVAALIGGLATYAYFSVRFVWPAMVLGYVVWQLLSSKITRSQLLGIGIGVVGSFVVFGATLLPMLRSPLYADSNRFRLSTASVLNADDEVLQSNVYREVAGNTLLDRVVFHRYWLMARNLGANYADHLDLRFLFFTGDANLRHGTGLHGLFLIPCMLPFIYGWYWLLRKHAGLAVWFGVWWMVALLPASVPETTPHALRSLNALMPLSLVMSVGVVAALAEVKKHWQRAAKGVLAVWLIAVGIGVVQFWQYYTHIYPTFANESWQGQYRELAQAVATQSYPVNVLTFDDRFYLWLMAYGPWEPVDWQHWPSQGFIFTEVPGVSYVHEQEWSKDASESTLWVGRSEEMDRLTSQSPLSRSSIGDKQGRPRFSTLVKPGVR